MNMIKRFHVFTLSVSILGATACGATSPDSSADEMVRSCADCGKASLLGEFVRPIVLSAGQDVNAVPAAKRTSAAILAVERRFGQLLPIASQNGKQVYGGTLVQVRDQHFETIDGRKAITLTTSAFIGSGTGFEYTTFVVHPANGDVYVVRVAPNASVALYGPLEPPASLRILGEVPARDVTNVGIAFNNAILGR
jgi:hypothetical protein